MHADPDLAFLGTARPLEVRVPAGHLRAALLTVRLLPVLHGAVSAVCELRFDAPRQACSLLVDAGCAVAGADETFVELLAKHRLQTDSSLSAVSKLLSAAVQVFEAVHEALLLDADCQALLRTTATGFELLAMLEFLQRASLEKHIFIRPEAGSPLETLAPGQPLKLQVFVSQVLGERVFRVFLSEEQSVAHFDPRRLRTAASRDSSDEDYGQDQEDSMDFEEEY